MRNITRIKLQLHLRITFISSTWSMYSYYNIYRKKERGIFRANINQTFDHEMRIRIFHRFRYFYRIFIYLLDHDYLIDFHWAIIKKQITRFAIEWYDFLYLNSGEKNIFIILDLSIKLLYTSSINIRQFSMESMSMTKVYCRTRSLILARKIQENEKLIQL